MKGSFATLLALMMTGMVSGQQPQYTNFQGKQNAVSANGLVGKYLLVLDENLVRGLRTQGELKARIDGSARPVIDHIVFQGSEENSMRTDLHPVGIQPAPATKGSRIVFELSDQVLEKMRTNGLIYIIGPEDRGRYDELVIAYKKPVSTTSDYVLIRFPSAVIRQFRRQ